MGVGYGDVRLRQPAPTGELADRGVRRRCFAKSIGAGADLASALRKLDEYKQSSRVRREQGVGLGLASGAFASSYIDNPRARESPLLTLGGLLRTHPTMEERIERLL